MQRKLGIKRTAQGTPGPGLVHYCQINLYKREIQTNGNKFQIHIAGLQMKNRKAENMQYKEKEMEKAQKISCGAVEAPLSSNFSRLANFNNPSFCQSILWEL